MLNWGCAIAHHSFFSQDRCRRYRSREETKSIRNRQTGQPWQGLMKNVIPLDWVASQCTATFDYQSHRCCSW